MPNDVPQLGWHHVAYDVIPEGIHLHIQEANEYPRLRFHWSLNVFTGERLSRFFIRDKEFATLPEAITAWPSLVKLHRRRIRL